MSFVVQSHRFTKSMETINCIFGVGGYAKDVHWIINDCYEASQMDYRPQYFVDKGASSIINILENEIPVVEEDFIFANIGNKNIRAFLAIGKPHIRKQVASKLAVLRYIEFPSILHPSAQFDRRQGYLNIGDGCIVSANSVLSTGVSLGKFVQVDYGATVGHESSIGDFVRISPGANISGNVVIENSTFIGAGAVVLENISICSDVVVGAGAVVLSSITEKGTYVGVPARRIERAK